jgi:hypothetical protein
MFNSCSVETPFVRAQDFKWLLRAAVPPVPL